MSGIDEPDLPPWPMRILLGASSSASSASSRHRRDDAGRRLVPLPVPDPVLGDVPDHHRRRQGRAGAAHDLRDRVPDREAHRQPHELVREGEEGPEEQGHGDDRRLHDELGQQQRLELVVRQLVVAADSPAAAAAPAAAAVRGAGRPRASGACADRTEGWSTVSDVGQSRATSANASPSSADPVPVRGDVGKPRGAHAARRIPRANTRSTRSSRAPRRARCAPRRCE